MKRYIKPNTDVTKVIFEGYLMSGTAVQTGGKAKDIFSSKDESYGKENEITSTSLWDDEEE